MIEAVADTFDRCLHGSTTAETDGSNVLVCESGTGTGKTFAYAIPGLVLARSVGKKLVISSSTVALQEQLAAKDLPFLQSCAPWPFSFALAKGRGRYVCPVRLDLALEAARQARLDGDVDACRLRSRRAAPPRASARRRPLGRRPRPARRGGARRALGPPDDRSQRLRRQPLPELRRLRVLPSPPAHPRRRRGGGQPRPGAVGARDEPRQRAARSVGVLLRVRRGARAAAQDRAALCRAAPGAGHLRLGGRGAGCGADGGPCAAARRRDASARAGGVRGRDACARPAVAMDWAGRGMG